MASAAAVFHGRPFGVRFLGPDGNFDRVVTFLNFGWWKGPDTPTIDVRVPWQVWSCEQPFGETGGVHLPDDYLIYADAAADGSLILKLCDRTKPYDAAEAAALGTPNPPRPDQATVTPTALASPTPTAPASPTPGTPASPTTSTPVGPDAAVPAVGHFGGRIRTIATDPDMPDLAWIAQGRTVTAVDLRDPDAPRLIGPGLQFPESVVDLAVDPPGAVALVGTRLVRLDIADPAQLRAVDSHDLAGLGDWLGPVVISGSLAVVGYDGPDMAGGVAYVDLVTGQRYPDLARPGQPVLTDLIRAGTHMAVASRSDWSAAGKGLLQIFPLAIDPGAPDHGVRELGRVEDPSINTLAYAKVDSQDRVYALGPVGIAGWDVSNPASPREVKRWPASWRPEGTAPERGAIAVSPDGAVFAALHRWIGSFYTAGSIVRVLDTPNAIGQWSEQVHLTIRPLDARLVVHAGGLLMAEATGFGRYDIAEDAVTEHGLVVDAVDVVASDIYGGASPAGGDPALFVTSNQSSLAMLGLEDPVLPDLRWALTDSHDGGGLTVDGGVASMATFGAGDIHNQAIDVLDVSSGAAPASRARIAGIGPPFDQTGRRLVVRSRPDTLALYDISDPAAPVERSSVTIAGQVSDVAVDGNRVVVAHYDRLNPGPDDPVAVRLTTLAIEGAGDALKLARHSEVTVEPHAVMDRSLPRVAIEGNVAWLILAIHCPSNPRFMLHGIDVANLDAPAWIPWGWEDLRGRPADIVAAEGHVFLPGEQLWMLDVRNPRLPAWAGRLGTTGGGSVAVRGRTVYVAEFDDGVGVYQPDLAWASDPNIPTPTPEVRPSSIPPTPTPDCRPTWIPGGTATDTPTPAVPATDTPTATPTPERGGVFLPWLANEL